jgi:hypothetical protein
MQRSSEFPPHFVGNVHVISGALIDRLLPRYGMAADCFPRAGGTVEAVLGKLDEADRAVLARELERLRQHRAALAAAHAELEQVRRRSRLPLRKRVTGALLRRLGRLMAAAGRADAAPAARDRE